MKNIYTSATKITFLMFATTICAGFFMDKIDVQSFMTIAMLPIAFYYGQKPQSPTTPQNLG